MSEQIDKDKLLLRINKELASLPSGMMTDITKSQSYTARRRLEELKDAIESSVFDIEPKEHENAYWAREGLIKKMQAEIESFKAITELAVKNLTEIISITKMPEIDAFDIGEINRIAELTIQKLGVTI